MAGSKGRFAPSFRRRLEGQEAALVMVRVEQRELLVAVHHIDEHAGQPDKGRVEVRQVLDARHGQLRTQISARVRQSPAGKLEGGIGTQTIDGVGILVAAGDREHAASKDIGQSVPGPAPGTWIAGGRRQSAGKTEPSLGQRRQHHSVVRGDASPSNAAVILWD